MESKKQTNKQTKNAPRTRQSYAEIKDILHRLTNCHVDSTSQIGPGHEVCHGLHNPTLPQRNRYSLPSTHLIKTMRFLFVFTEKMNRLEVVGKETKTKITNHNNLSHFFLSDFLFFYAFCWSLFWWLFVVVVDFALHCFSGDGDVAQLVERRTGMPLAQVHFPSAARDFSLRVNIRYRLLRCPYTPYVQSHSLTSVRMLKIL